MGLLYFITNYAITHYKYLKIDKKIRRGAPSGVLGCQRPAAASGQLDSTMTYPVGPVKSLQGVYNINRGYCIVRQIVPIEQNTDYLVVAENTDYGISVYDHIVLNASLVKDGQLVYQ